LSDGKVFHSPANLLIFRGQESETVEKLPDFSLPSLRAQKAIKTGTDEQSVFDSSLASSLHKQGVLERTGLDCSAQIICSSDEKTAFSKANGRIPAFGLEPKFAKQISIGALPLWRPLRLRSGSCHPNNLEKSFFQTFWRFES